MLNELHVPHGGSSQSGISGSSEHPEIIIFSGSTGAKFGSVDEAGVYYYYYYYTGEGQTGDIQFLRGNAATCDHARSWKCNSP